ncbi:hypothetical protein FO519_002798 [Halicephalobus sp. NKZ332]|nr:hypothetical protein FO519_002798 [Halicephalobus sp. NKZ332]
MAHKSGEAHRALERLEEYHAELTRPSDAELKYAIEKIIGIFKTRLFQALCDIQDFYDNTLINERISFDDKTRETKRLAERWENNPPFGAFGGYTTGSLLERPLTNGYHATDGHNVSTHSYTFQEQKKELTRDGWATTEYTTKTVGGPGGVHTQTTSASGLIDSQGQEWDVEDVIIEKNQTGLGFSISGGRDRGDSDPHIRVTDISKGGAVARDGRIKVNDIILKVNNTDCVDVDHNIAVQALKNSGTVVRLMVKRPRPTRSVSQHDLRIGGTTTGFSSSYGQTPTSVLPPPLSSHHSPLAPVSIPIQRIPPEIQRLELNPSIRKLELVKGAGGLGFSIAGGVGNQHVPGDNGIYITRIIEGGAAYFDGRLQSMDRILAVDNVLLENVTHSFAVNTLKSTGQRVTIYYEKNPHPNYVPPPIDDSSRSFTGIAAANRSGSIPQFPDQSYGSQGHLAYGSGIPTTQTYEPEISLAPRVVTLKKGDGGLGFNIVGGEDREPIYISHVLPGGVADLSGNIRKGDVLLQVNDVELRNATHNAAALALKNCFPNSYVNLTLQYRPADYAAFEAKVEALRNDMLNRQASAAATIGVNPATVATRRDVFVRALFDYDPSRETGVPHRTMGFRYGDILHVLNANDDEWWTARRISENGDEGGEVNSAEEPIFSYETVEVQNINYVRPVIILGAMKDRINDEIVGRYPDKFSSCVPHTSRPARENEVHGRDYYFVSKAEMENDVRNNMFIEAGQFQDNLYGTSINAVREVANSGRHCILDVSGNAIRRLQNTANIHPIAILIKPHSPQQIREWDPSLPDSEAQRAYDRVQRIEQNFGDLFSAIVTGYNFEDIMNKVIMTIGEHGRPRIWAPNHQPLP